MRSYSGLLYSGSGNVFEESQIFNSSPYIDWSKEFVPLPAKTVHRYLQRNVFDIEINPLKDKFFVNITHFSIKCKVKRRRVANRFREIATVAVLQKVLFSFWIVPFSLTLNRSSHVIKQLSRDTILLIFIRDYTIGWNSVLLTCLCRQGVAKYNLTIHVINFILWFGDRLISEMCIAMFRDIWMCPWREVEDEYSSNLGLPTDPQTVKMSHFRIGQLELEDISWEQSSFSPLSVLGSLWRVMSLILLVEFWIASWYFLTHSFHCLWLIKINLFRVGR